MNIQLFCKQQFEQGIKMFRKIIEKKTQFFSQIKIIQHKWQNKANK